jgi:hypothetical protein
LTSTRAVSTTPEGVVGPPCSPSRTSIHKAKGPAPFHSIESVDNLISIENGYQPVHHSRGVARAECNVFPKDAPGILDGRQYLASSMAVNTMS